MSKRPVSALTDHLGYWLRALSNEVSHAFARKLEDKGVTTAEWVVMRVLYDWETMAPSAVADRMGMTRGAISKLADRLMVKRMIARAENPDDGRAHVLSLTDEGRRLVPVLARLADENDAEFFGVLAPDERARLQTTLQELIGRRGVDRPPVD